MFGDVGLFGDTADEVEDDEEVEHAGEGAV